MFNIQIKIKYDISVGRSVGRSISRSVSQLVDQLVGRTISQQGVPVYYYISSTCYSSFIVYQPYIQRNIYFIKVYHLVYFQVYEQRDSSKAEYKMIHTTPMHPPTSP